MVPIALFGWIPVILLVFASFPPRRAMIFCFVFGWLFLPPAGYEIPGFPDYTKVTATTFGVLLAIILFDWQQLLSIRCRLFDMPMICWCLCPFASSISNGLGVYDGLSAIFEQTSKWGLPYLIGRVYLRNLNDFREVAIILFLGGLVYTPFCLWEIRMSPQLGRYLYGIGGVGIEYFNEFGKWGSRPRVFMGNALIVGTFMTAASLMGIWLWKTRCLTSLWGLSAASLTLLLLITTLLCKNLGALALLALGTAALFSTKRLHSSVVIYLLILASPLYMSLRITGKWSATPLVNTAAIIHEQRASSLQFRLNNEDLLAAKALQRPVFGWGRWGRARVYREDGKDISVTDGLWVIALGNTGVVGLVTLTMAMLLPPVMFLRRYPARTWVHPAIAPAAALAVLVTLYMIDNLFNDMLNPIYVVTAGGLARLATAQTTSCVIRQSQQGWVPQPTANLTFPMDPRCQGQMTQ